ncbi:MAG TPA: rRNA maturation RNase YbeY [Burkholderiales bacterium]|nr:rRNA maturation RNase YbeY [Burkholderiales bacterium]
MNAKSDKKLNLTVQYRVRGDNLPSRWQLRKWTLAALTQRAQITMRIVGEKEGRGLNRDFLGRDYATDVLTFTYPGSRPLTGDIALCAPVVRREASEHGISLKACYAHLVVHGVLHLQGYDHHHRAEARKMEKMEAQIITRLGFPDPHEHRE